MTKALFDAAAGWLLFASLAVALGAVAGRWLIVPGADARSDAWTRHTARFGRAGVSALGVALAMVFVRQLLEFRDPFVPWTEDAHLLLTVTPWGRSWVGAVALAAVGWAGLHAAAGGRAAGWWAAGAALLALGCFPALTGHANAAQPRAAALAADVLHVWAAGAWIGGLALVLRLDRATLRTDGDPSEGALPVLVPRFSRVAQGAVAALLVTGVFGGWLHVGGWGALASTDYGRLLLGKALVASAVLGLGAVNQRRWSRRLGDPAGRAGLRRTAAWELALANVVLVLTALLVRTSPM